MPRSISLQLAKVYVAIDDCNEALNKLEKAYQVSDVWMYNLNSDPVFDPIRSEPRFKAILKKMNLGVISHSPG